VQLTDPVPILAAEVAPGAAVGQALLALNNAHSVALSWLDAGRFRHLVREAHVALRIGEAEALLLGFDPAADYDSPNFLWFRDRLGGFLYVDRVVVAAGARGQGLARRLYREVFEAAGRAGLGQVVCEVNADPPNPASDAFHAALGFTEMGTGVLDLGRKKVRYLVRPLGP